MYQNPMKTRYKVQMHLLFRQRAVSHAAEYPAAVARRSQAVAGRGRWHWARPLAQLGLLPCPALNTSAGIDVQWHCVLCFVSLTYTTRWGRLGTPHDRTRSRAVAALRRVSSAQGLPGPTAQPCHRPQVGCWGLSSTVAESPGSSGHGAQPGAALWVWTLSKGGKDLFQS